MIDTIWLYSDIVGFGHGRVSSGRMYFEESFRTIERKIPLTLTPTFDIIEATTLQCLII